MEGLGGDSGACNSWALMVGRGQTKTTYPSGNHPIQHYSAYLLVMTNDEAIEAMAIESS